MRNSLRIFRRALLTILLGGLLGGSLLRFSPGWGLDERQMDARLSSESRQAAHAEYESERNVFLYYGHYLRAAASGDLGVSRTFNRPVAELMRERHGGPAGRIGAGHRQCLRWVA
jgi:ABC-type dipeptide/oligopeptide/nickel transport system permease component